MANHESGDKIRADKADEHVDLTPSPARIDAGEGELLGLMGPVEGSTKEDWRRAYADMDRTLIYAKSQPKATAGYGFYGEHLGNTLFAPPVEFGGYGGGHAGYHSSTDAFSHPARYGYGGGYYGYQGREGWVYSRGGHTNIDHQRIAQCLLLYKTEGVVQTIVHLLADFVVESIDLVHPDDTVHNFYQAWKTKVRLKDRLHRFVVDLLTSGNVFIWTKLAKLKSGEKQTMKRGVAAQLIGDDLVLEVTDKDGKRLRHKTVNIEFEGDTFAKLKELNEACREHANAGRVNEIMLGKAENRNDPEDPRDTKKQPTAEIPWGYISLNPLQMEPRGSRFANEHYWVMLLQQRDLKPLSKFMTYRYYTDITTTKVNLPEIFKGKLQPLQGKNRRMNGYAAELRLDEERLSVIHDVTKADYEDWATPQIYPAHKEVSFKRMLRQGEISAMESLKHMITLIKLGKVEEGFIPTEEQLERVAAALAGGSQTHHLVWDDLIDGQVLQPNIGNIFDPKKYQQIDKDIYSALGVSESVMTGNGSFANSFMSIKLLLEKLETIRCKLEDWLLVEVKKIADSMKFRRMPRIEWGLMNLRDENTERKLWLDLYDRGIVSDTSLLERFGTDFDIEKARQEIEQGFKEEKNKDLLKDDKKFRSPVMVSRGPFNRDLINKQQQKSPQAKNNGRPSGTGTPQSKKRNTKPKGMSSVIDFQKHSGFAQGAIKIIQTIATEMAIKNQDVRDIRYLSKAQKEDLENIILYTLGALDPSVEVTSDLVYKLLSDDSNVLFESEKCKKIVATYKEVASDASTKEERLELMCNTFAAINADLLENNDEAS